MSGVTNEDDFAVYPSGHWIVDIQGPAFDRVGHTEDLANIGMKMAEFLQHGFLVIFTESAASYRNVSRAAMLTNLPALAPGWVNACKILDLSPMTA